MPFPRCRMLLISVLRTFACVSSYFRSFSLNSSCTLSFCFPKVPLITGPKNLFCACHICIQDRDFNIFQTDTIVTIGQPRKKWTCFLAEARANILYVMILKHIYGILHEKLLPVLLQMDLRCLCSLLAPRE